MVIQPVSGSPPAPVEERVEVALRLLDVVVTGAKGRPVTGLGPEAFEIRVDGTIRPIRSFDAATGPAPGLSSSGNLPAVPLPNPSNGRSVVILLDADRIPHNHRKIVLDTARAIVRESGGPLDRFAIALLRNNELVFLQEFAPRDQVQIKLLEDPGMLLGRADDLRHRLDEMVALVEGCADAAQRQSCVLTRTEEFLAVLRRENERALASLRGLVAAMAPLPGRKALVWFSNGLVLEPGQVVLDAANRYVGDTRYILSRLEDRGSRAYESMMAEATRAGVTVFSLRAGHDMGPAIRGADRAGNSPPVGGGADPYRLATDISEASLRNVAEATGGRVVFTPLTPRIAPDLLDQLDAIYTLGIRADPRDRPGARVKIKLRDGKGKVRLRPRLPVIGRVPDQLVIRLREPSGTEDRGVGVAVSVGLRNVELGAEGEKAGELSRLAVFARLLDEEGSQVESHYRILSIPRGPGTPAEFEYRVPFSVAPGDYRVEVSVSDLVGKGLGSAVMEIRHSR